MLRAGLTDGPNGGEPGESGVRERKKPYLAVKRVLDVLFALLLGVPAAIVILPLYLWIKLDEPAAPVFFVQERPGYHGKVFRIFKLRTMSYAEKGQEIAKYPGAERITKVGKFLRQWSLDELPQIWNVLVGDMSFIGPRPLIVEYLPMYTPEQMRRHDVLPGITGWAQVNGRNAVSWDQQFALDVWYVDHVSFPLDCKILFMTFASVLSRKGSDAWEDRREANGDAESDDDSPFNRY